MLSSVSTLLLRLMVYRSVVYRNGIGVMNIQLSEEHSIIGRTQENVEKEKKQRGFQTEPGLERRRSWSRGPELGRWSLSRGPREEGCSKQYEHEEEEVLNRT